MKVKKYLNWTHVIFFTLTPLVGIVGMILLCVFGLVSWPTWVLAGSLVVITGLSITAGYHRLFAHGTYKASWPVRLFFLLFGAAAFQGSVLEWSSDHVNHHRYADTEKDPYSVNKGFWFAHIGWIFRLDPSKRDFSNVKELLNDPLVRFQHRYYLIISNLMGFVLPAAIAALWLNPIAGLIIAGAFRITFVHHGTFLINSACHYFGRRTYLKDHTARDNWFAAFFTFGEGYHSFHHKFAKDYRNGVRFYQYDPTKWLINVLSWFGLTYNLNRINKNRILQYRVRAQAEGLLTQAENKAKLVYERVLKSLSRIERLERKYKELKQNRFQYIAGKMQDYRKIVHRHRARVKIAERQLKVVLSEWSDVLVSRKLEAVTNS